MSRSARPTSPAVVAVARGAARPRTGRARAGRYRTRRRVGAGAFRAVRVLRQWQGIRDAARSRGILLFGDLPIFVAHDSAEVWTHRHYFNLDAHGQPRVVAGVPPDYFSETGQRWGNPLYDWPQLAADGFRFWVERPCAPSSRCSNLVRIDHFRGFQPTGRSRRRRRLRSTSLGQGPGAALFKALAHEFGTVRWWPRISV